MPVILETAYLVVNLDRASSIVRYARTATPYPSAADTIREHVELGGHLDLLRRQDLGLLVDVREAPYNPSPSFESAIAQGRKHLFRGFPRIAILVRSAIGALQLARHVREDGLEIPVLRDEQEAIRLVARTLDAPPSSRRSQRPLIGDLRLDAPPSSRKS